MFKYLKTGQKIKTHFKDLLKPTTILRAVHIADPDYQVVLELTMTDLKKLPALFKRRSKENKSQPPYFVHLSPDVSIFIVSGKKDIKRRRSSK